MTPSPLDAYRAAYDHHERVQLEVAGFQRQDCPHVVRHLPTKGDYGFITYTKPAPFDIPQEIATQVAECRPHCQVLEWKVYSFDPLFQQTSAALEAAGFSQGEEEFLLVYDLTAHQPADLRYRSLDIRCLATKAAIEEAVGLQNAIFGEKTSVTPARLLDNQEARKRDPSIAIDDLYAVYLEDGPVAVSRLSHYPASPFAGMWGGGTLAAHRGKGYYAAMVNARADAAIALGKKYLMIEAASTSRPIVEKLGFQLLGSTWPWEKVLA